jgi:hypothetical protein
MRVKLRTYVVAALIVVLTGCGTTGMPPVSQGQAVGAGIGAILGGIAGANTGGDHNKAGKAVLGAVLGGGAGYLIGGILDKPGQPVNQQASSPDRDLVRSRFERAMNDHRFRTFRDSWNDDAGNPVTLAVTTRAPDQRRIPPDMRNVPCKEYDITANSIVDGNADSASVTEKLGCFIPTTEKPSGQWKTVEYLTPRQRR